MGTGRNKKECGEGRPLLVNTVKVRINDLGWKGYQKGETFQTRNGRKQYVGRSDKPWE